eukprot:TRINITY_DN2612_c0_g1_i1.p1 TRINITY_DN2612_c0_g1~~TRINITY_DN2612_c0_g1_i1.p1  ORF type:complete len:377 (-),score=76.74 TRINITY_DN2612_c0_g1_i1:14-1144(-)
MSELDKDHIAAGLGKLGRTVDGQAIVFLRVDLSNLELTAIDALREYVHLQEIDLHNNSLRSLAALKNLPHLTWLDASINQLEDPLVVEEATCLSHSGSGSLLQHLCLSRNGFTVLPRHDNLTHLRFLDLDGNKLTSLFGLAELPNLTSLSLKENALEDISGLSSLGRSLRFLHLDHNKITRLDAVEHLTSLEVLTLEANDVLHLNSLALLTKLTEVDLAGNNLHHIAEVTALSALPVLAALTLADNPFCLPPLGELPADPDDATDVVQPDPPIDPPRKAEGQEELALAAGSRSNLKVSLKATLERTTGPKLDISVFSPPGSAESESQKRPKQPLDRITQHQADLRLKVIGIVPQLIALDGVAVSAEEKVRARVTVA